MKKGILLFILIALVFSSCSRKSIKQKTETDGQTAATIAEQYLKNTAGDQKIDTIRSLGFDAIGELAGVIINLKIIKTADGKKTVEASMDNRNPQKTVWNGKDGYVMTSNGKTPLSESTKQDFLKSRILFPELDFAKDKNIKLVGKEMVWEEPAYKIVAPNITYYYDVKSGMKVRETIRQIIDGKTVESPTTYSNYQKVDGLLLPFSFEEKINGYKTRFRILRYYINTAQPKDFQ